MSRSKEPEYEIALVNRDGTASLIEGPFDTLANAVHACSQLNAHTQNKPWQVYFFNTCPRAVTCTVRKPNS